MSEQHPPAAFATVLADPSHPLIVGGQAVNLWAHSLAESPHEKVRRFALQQLPRLADPA